MGFMDVFIGLNFDTLRIPIRDISKITAHRKSNRHNTFDQARIGTLGIKPQYVTEVFVDKENADMALHIIHTLS